MKTENLTNHLNQSLDRFSRFVIYGIQKTQQRTKSNQSKLHIDENCFFTKNSFLFEKCKIFRNRDGYITKNEMLATIKKLTTHQVIIT